MTTKQKDRLGQAIVSFIFSLLSLFPLFLFFYTFDNVSYRMGFADYTVPQGTVVVIIIEISLFLLLSLISIILGVRARKSSSGRGLAITGMTISIIVLAIIAALLILLIIFALQEF